MERINSFVSAFPLAIPVVLVFLSGTFVFLSALFALKLVKRRRAAAAEAAGAEKLHLAVATLLAVVARGDGRIDTAERAVIERFVRARFGLSADEAGRLIDARCRYDGDRQLTLAERSRRLEEVDFQTGA